MSSKDQEILRLQVELARLQAECTMLEELNRKREEELKQLEAAKSKITTLETASIYTVTGNISIVEDIRTRLIYC